MNSVFDKWKREIKKRITKCQSMGELKKALSDELYGVNEYLDECLSYPDPDKTQPTKERKR